MTALRSALTTGVSAVFGSSAAATTELERADQLLRAPLPLSRRIGFVAVAGGSGVSSTAAHVASTYATRRNGMVLAVDAAAGSAGLSWRSGVPGPPEGTATAHVLARAHARSSAEAARGLPRTPQGLHLLDLRRGDLVAPSIEAWSAAVRPSGRFFDVVVSDFGVRPATADLASAAATSHVVVLVARADRRAAAQAAAVLSQLADLAEQPRPVLVLVDVGRTDDRAAAALRAELDVPVHLIRHDPSRAAAVPGQRRLSARVRLDVLRLSAALMQVALDGEGRRAG